MALLASSCICRSQKLNGTVSHHKDVSTGVASTEERDLFYVESTFSALEQAKKNPIGYIDELSHADSVLLQNAYKEYVRAINNENSEIYALQRYAKVIDIIISRSNTLDEYITSLIVSPFTNTYYGFIDQDIKKLARGVAGLFVYASVTAYVGYKFSRFFPQKTICSYSSNQMENSRMGGELRYQLNINSASRERNLNEQRQRAEEIARQALMPQERDRRLREINRWWAEVGGWNNEDQQFERENRSMTAERYAEVRIQLQQIANRRNQQLHQWMDQVAQWYNNDIQAGVMPQQPQESPGLVREREQRKQHARANRLLNVDNLYAKLTAQAKALFDSNKNDDCNVCMDNKNSHPVCKAGHATCTECFYELFSRRDKCPQCRVPVESVV